MVMHNEHQPTDALREKIADLAVSGIPPSLIAKIVKIDIKTLKKHYEYELECSEPEVVARVGKVVAINAENGDPRAQALFLKTIGAKYGWVEKQVIEQKNNEEMEAMRKHMAEIEKKYERDH